MIAISQFVQPAKVICLSGSIAGQPVKIDKIQYHNIYSNLNNIRSICEFPGMTNLGNASRMKENPEVTLCFT